MDNSVQSFTQTFIGFFPTNIVENFRANDIIPIIVVGVVLSIAYLSLAERKPDAVLVRPFGELVEALKLVIFKVVGYVIRLTPYAIVAITATTVGAELEPRQGVLVAARAAGAHLGRLLLPRLRHQRRDAAHRRARLAGRVLPQDLPGPAHRVHHPEQRRHAPGDDRAAHAQGRRPPGGRLLHGAARHHDRDARLRRHLADADRRLGHQRLRHPVQRRATTWCSRILGVVVSIGTAGVPGAATVSAATVLSAAGLPLEFVAVTLPISTIADMARTMTNVTAAAVSATVVARQTGLLDDEIFDGRAEFVEEDELAASRDRRRPVRAGRRRGARRRQATGRWSPVAFVTCRSASASPTVATSPATSSPRGVCPRYTTKVIDDITD